MQILSRSKMSTSSWYPMETSVGHGRRRSHLRREHFFRWTTSFVVTLLSHLSLLVVPLFFPSHSLLLSLCFSGLVLLIVAAVAKAFKNLFKLRGSAPALVFFNLLFVWFVYLVAIRQETSTCRDVVFNGGLALLVFGFLRVLFGDPGVIRHKVSNLDNLHYRSISEVATIKEDLQPSTSDSSCGNSADVSSFSMKRIRYCKICENYVKGFDHHCPAFGNCIGDMNHGIFMVLLVGFITMEGVYIISSYEFVRRYELLGVKRSEVITDKILVAASTMLFCLLQVIWQVAFLAWHVYCICFNIRTDEWINWKRYPEFQLTDHSSGGTKFTNPHNKGTLHNLKEFLSTRGRLTRNTPITMDEFTHM